MTKACLIVILALCCAMALSVSACLSTTTTTALPAPLATWTNLNPTGKVPSARSEHSMVYVPTTGQVLLFGGSDTVARNDTWAYDPTANAWTELHPTGALPLRRTGHSMVYDPASGKVVLFGGWNPDEGSLNDTWAYDPAANTWAELHPSGGPPLIRSGHCMVYDPTNGQLILFGGITADVNFSDTWAYDPVTNYWTNLNPAGDLPTARDHHSMVWDPPAGKVLLFGGWASQGPGATVLSDTWVYDPATNSWTELNPAGTVPHANNWCSMVYDPSTGKVILVGASWDPADAVNHTWAYDPPANCWSDLSPAGAAPSARFYHQMVYDPTISKVILFGGANYGDRFNETWAYGVNP